MSNLRSLLLAFAFLGAVVQGHLEASPTRVKFAHELPEGLGKRWRMVDPYGDELGATATKPMRVYFMMKHCRHAVKKLEDRLLRISDPRMKEYGQHLSLEELERALPVASEKVEAVVNFLKAHGVSEYKVNPNRDMIQADLDPTVAEEMFQTRVRLFQGTAKFSRNVFLYRAVESFSLPVEVANAIDIVGDLQYFPSIRHPIVQDIPDVGRGHWENDCDGFAACKGLVTPGVLRKRYSVTDSRKEELLSMKARSLKGIKNSMAVAEFQGQYYDDKDLEQFDQACHVNVSVDKVVGKDVQVGGLESMLDIEYIKSLAPEVPLAFVYLEEYSLLNWAYQISTDSDPQWVHSVSYGNDEAQQVSTEYMFSVNVQLIKAGSRGLSILFASGDQGVCGREGCGFLRRRYKPDFPAGSPYVTAVGGTDFLTYEIGEEKAWNCGGGGFSDTFDMPEFQKDAVERYKSVAASSLPRRSVWNSTSRGYPDVSALGGQKTPYCIVARGLSLGIAGTSASAPVVSAIFAKLNGVRIAAGKPPLGFLNPFIYQNMDSFNDVTHGSNGCAPFTKGFKATTGWDPATGVGTPNYAKLKSKVMAMSR